ncbi:MAG TPA: hypothetical protein VNC78_03125 [Actinomycetota bacterium]|nr:hypothetical protein [Actinomycetota bacterium]
MTTVHLGQFTDEHANAIAGQLEERGIAWWYKQPGYFSRIWERGTRLFVDSAHLDEARLIAKDVLEGVVGDPGPPADG